MEVILVAVRYVRLGCGPVCVRHIPTAMGQHERVMVGAEDGSVGVVDIDAHKVRQLSLSRVVPRICEN